jgi:excinuclease ABC subunit A
VIAAGTPEEVAGEPASHTGEFLRELLVPKRKPTGGTRNGNASGAKTRGGRSKKAITTNGAAANGLVGTKRKGKSAEGVLKSAGRVSKSTGRT